MADTIVPFGKYKGQPVEAMAADKQYLDWLTAQPWFREKFQNIYTLVVNNLQEPTETPEHNKLQALFLDAAFRRKFIEKVHAKDFSELSIQARFESHGFDVLIMASQAWSETKPRLYFDCHIEIKPTVGDEYPAVLRQIKNSRVFRYTEPAYDGRLKHQQFEICHPVLFLERYTGVGATEEQFIQIFEADGIEVIFLDEVT